MPIRKSDTAKKEETMKQSLIIFATLALLAGPTWAEDLRKLPLDEASAIGTTIQTDSQVKAEGKGSIKITTLWIDDILLAKEPIK
jgi:hypothetical protein